MKGRVLLAGLGACLLVAGLTAGTALAADNGAAQGEMVDNPAYKAWAQYKPGTSVTYKTEMQMEMPEGKDMPAGFKMPKMESTTTQKLLEVTPEKVVVEVSIDTAGMRGMGGRKLAPQKHDIPAKVEKGQEDIPAAMVREHNIKVKDVKDGKDTVEIMGKKVDTTTKEMTTESTHDNQTMTNHMKVWMTRDIPGGVARMTNDIQKPMKGQMTMVVSDYTIAK